MVIGQLKSLKDSLSLNPRSVIADSEYDSANILKYILDTLCTRSRISRNPRKGAASTSDLNSSGVPVCIADLICYPGDLIDRDQNRMHHKFVYPIKGSKKFARDHPYCPWFHPRFIDGSGCYRYLMVD